MEMSEETEKKSITAIGALDIPQQHKALAVMGVLMHANPDAIMNVIVDGASKRRGENLCDFEKCPGRSTHAKKRLIYHEKYLFVHGQCVPGARSAANRRGETFAFRLGL